MLPDASTAIDAVYRSDWGRIVATLIRLVGDFDVAEEAAQEAFAAAVDQWQASGVPESPRAWIIQTARHKAIDRIRRRTRLAEKLQSYAASSLIPRRMFPNATPHRIAGSSDPTKIAVSHQPRHRNVSPLPRYSNSTRSPGGSSDGSARA